MSITLNAASIRAHLDEWGFPRTADVLIPDSQYSFWPAEFVYGEFADKARRVLWQVVGPWDEEVADCDDFAKECSAYAGRVHRKTKDRPKQAALAFGEFYFTRRDGERHVINCFIALKNDAWHLYFLEPQGCVQTELNQEEFQSCRSLRF